MSSDEVVAVVGASDGSGWYWDTVALCLANAGVWWRGGGRYGADCGPRPSASRVWGSALSACSGSGHLSLPDPWAGPRPRGSAPTSEPRGSGQEAGGSAGAIDHVPLLSSSRMRHRYLCGHWRFPRHIVIPKKQAVLELVVEKIG